MLILMIVSYFDTLIRFEPLNVRFPTCTQNFKAIVPIIWKRYAVKTNNLNCCRQFWTRYIPRFGGIAIMCEYYIISKQFSSIFINKFIFIFTSKIPQKY